MVPPLWKLAMKAGIALAIVLAIAAGFFAGRDYEYRHPWPRPTSTSAPSLADAMPEMSRQADDALCAAVRVEDVIQHCVRLCGRPNPGGR